MIKQPTILVIDDIQDNIAILRALLIRHYPEAVILYATSGERGIELAKSTTPDLIYLDVLMPGLDGFSVCTELKMNEKLKGIPIVFVTALKESREIKLKAISVGADGFIQKPIDEMMLLTMTNAMLKVREAERLKENEKERLRLLVKQRTYLLEKELEKRTHLTNTLQNSEDLYKGLVDNLDSGVVIHQPDTSISDFNERAAEILKLPVQDAFERKVDDEIWNFIDTNENPLQEEDYPVSIVIRENKPLKNYVIGIVSEPDGNVTWVSCNAHPRYHTNGDLKEVVVSFYDVTDRVEYERQLVFAANYDYLTKLHNRRYYETALRKLTKEDVYPITIAIADINGLKLINDAFGHLYGDKMLCKTADVIKQVIEPNGIVARIGGDEFGIVMTNTTSEEAEKRVQRIHSLAREIKIQSIELSISIGYSSKIQSGEDLFDISRSAEDIMYRQKLIEIPSMRSNAIETILTTLYEKDRYSEYHSRQVSRMAANLGRVLGLESQMIKDIETAGLVHDIGKIIIPSSIINKKGRLDENEREIINTHPEIGFRILNSSSQLREISDIVLNHHERYDGMGYPRNIKGQEIPLQSRIISIADAFEAMTSNRPYRKRFSVEKAKGELLKNKGTQFDPQLVDVFLEHIDEIVYRYNEKR